MIRDDYLLRMIRQAVAAIAAVMRGEQTAERAVPAALLSVTGMAPRLLDRLPPEALLQMMRAGADGAAQAQVVGALLTTWPDGDHRRLQALTLLADAGPDARVRGIDPAALIEELLAHGDPLPPRLHARLFRWFVHAEDLDRADDHLHAAGGLPGVREQARAALLPLRDWAPERLAAAGWTPAELADVLDELAAAE